MTIDWTKPIETTDGRAARLICDDFQTVDGCTRVVLVSTGAEEVEIAVYARADGVVRGGAVSNIHLRNRVERRTVYLNIYPEARGPGAHYTRANADQYMDRDRIACVKVDFEFREGQFDD